MDSEVQCTCIRIQVGCWASEVAVRALKLYPLHTLFLQNIDTVAMHVARLWLMDRKKTETGAGCHRQTHSDCVEVILGRRISKLKTTHG